MSKTKPLVRRVMPVDSASGGQCVLKLSPDPVKNPKAAARFRVEFDIMGTLTGTPGVVPILDRGETDDRPWFVMPKARELAKHLGLSPHLRDVVAAVAVVADTLANIADTFNIAHRDLKPANLLWLNGPLVADFGIAKVPKTSPDITQKGELLGPREFLAPEMRYYLDGVDGNAADVWSLAKTLFALAQPTPSRWPPVGTLTAQRPEFSLRPAGGQAAADLEYLLEGATAYTPRRRPSMRTFANELSAWLDYHPDPAGRRPPPPEPTRIRVRRFGDPEAQADWAVWRRRSDELRRRVRQTMNTITDAGFIENGAAGYLLDDHGHDEYSNDQLHAAATTVSRGGLRLVLAGFLVRDSDAQYIVEEQRQISDGSLTLSSTHCFEGAIEMPSGLTAVRNLQDTLGRLAASHEFPPAPDDSLDDR